jgi:hypothetical protein
MSDPPPTDAIPPAEPTGVYPPIAPRDPAPTPEPPVMPAADEPPPAAAGAAPAPAPAATSSGGGVSIEPWGWLALLAVVAVLLGLLVDEDGANLWDASEAWSIFAIACSIAVLAPLLRKTLKWTDERAWIVAALGAGGLVLYWLLLVLPAIARNTSFAITAGVAAAVGAVWLAPGRRDLTG